MSIKEQFTTNLDRVSSSVKQAFNVATSVIDTVQDPVGALSNLGSKYSTENLRFPRDVENPDVGIGNHGHYILFSINTQERAKLRTSAIGSGGSRVDDITRDANIPAFLNNWDVVSGTYKKMSADNLVGKQLSDTYEKIQRTTGGASNPAIALREGRDIGKFSVDSSYQSKGSTIKIKRAPTKRLKTQIAMYMPQQVNVTYGANFTDTEMGALTEEALNAYNNAIGGRFRSAFENVLNMDQGIAEQLQKGLLASIGIIPGFGGAREAFEAKEGAIISDRLELAFKGINKRVFQYTFKMIPKNPQEADEIRKIVFAFKANMLPEFVGGNRAGRRLVVPNTFDISYMYVGAENDYLHKISTCVLENMNVTYGGDRYKTFEGRGDGAPPVETTITLNFKEMELITRERVFEGF
tara:strand:+ start:230 stop:1459 length:1230 start_codon:yes stop_codon:yes gene_type:complete